MTSYSYDVTGHHVLQVANQISSTYRYAAVQLVSGLPGLTTFSYDANGNLLM